MSEFGWRIGLMFLAGALAGFCVVAVVFDALRVERRHRREFRINPLFQAPRQQYIGHTHSFYHDKCIICGVVRTPIDRGEEDAT